MRTKRTNYLQVVVMLSGILYMAAGAIFFISPSFFAKFLPVPVNDEWATQARLDEFLMMLFMYCHVLSVLLFFCGMSLIMPLFDPLKYRSLIYLFCIFAPFIATLYSIVGFLADNIKSALAFAIFFFFIFVINLSAIIIT